MSLEIKDKHYAAVHVGNPAKSFSASESNEAERRGWDEETYRLKNHDMNNHYDITRKHLNFEINGDGEIVPLGSNPIPLHERLLQRLEQLGFKQYKDKNNPSVVANNSPNCTIGIIISGDHDVLDRALRTGPRTHTPGLVNAGVRRISSASTCIATKPPRTSIFRPSLLP